VVICAVVGIALGAVLASVRGQGMGIVSFGFQMLFGVGLFVGLVSTTGTVNVYDKVRNAHQPVGGVPNLIVLVAGATNLMERALSEVIDDNTTDPDAWAQAATPSICSSMPSHRAARSPTPFSMPRSRTMSASAILSRGGPPMPSMTISSSAPRPISRPALPPWPGRRPTARSTPPLTRRARP
jgi:hypothetical protein